MAAEQGREDERICKLDPYSWAWLALSLRCGADATAENWGRSRHQSSGEHTSFLSYRCVLPWKGHAWSEIREHPWPADPWTLPDGTGEVGSWEIAEGPGPGRRAPRETPVAPFAVLQRPIRWELGQEGVAPAKRPTGQLMSRRRRRRVPRTAKPVGVITVMGGAGASGGWQGGMSPARRACRPRVTRPAQGGQALSVGKGGVIARAAGGTQPGEETPARGSANDDGVWRRFP